MSFHVGQKVVCIIQRDRWVVHCGYSAPEKGAVYTVRRIVAADDDGPECIMLDELASPSFHREPSYFAAGFRPLGERKTDISIFTAMLTPNKQKVGG